MVDFFWVVATQIFLFLPLPGEMIQFDEHIFQMGWFNHQLVFAWPSQKTTPSQNYRKHRKHGFFVEPYELLGENYDYWDNGGQ